MSNLSLPKMTYDTLRNLLGSGSAFRTGTAKLAYETTAEWRAGRQSIIVRHHGNVIAEIGQHYFTISGAGWNSVTTATRLAKILRDNQTSTVEGSDRVYYSVSSRYNKRESGLFITGRTHGGKVRLVRNIQFGVAHFSRVDSDHHYVLHGEG